MLPGFITGVFGALIMLPPVRALLRPVLLAWMGVGPLGSHARAGCRASWSTPWWTRDGRVRTRTRTVGEVIDSDGWDVADAPSELPLAGPHSGVIDGHLVDGDGPVPPDADPDR